MSEAFICKDQHYEIISKVENEEQFYVPARDYAASGHFSKSYNFNVGGPLLYYIFEALTSNYNNTVNVTLNTKFSGTNSIQIMTINPFSQTIQSGGNRATYSYNGSYTFLYTQGNAYFSIQVHDTIRVGFNDEEFDFSVATPDITVLLLYKLQS